MKRRPMPIPNLTTTIRAQAGRIGSTGPEQEHEAEAQGIAYLRHRMSETTYKSRDRPAAARPKRGRLRCRAIIMLAQEPAYAVGRNARKSKRKDAHFRLLSGLREGVPDFGQGPAPMP